MLNIFNYFKLIIEKLFEHIIFTYTLKKWIIVSSETYSSKKAIQRIFRRKNNEQQSIDRHTQIHGRQ